MIYKSSVKWCAYIQYVYILLFFAMKPDFKEWLYEKRKIKIQNR